MGGVSRATGQGRTRRRRRRRRARRPRTPKVEGDDAKKVKSTKSSSKSSKSKSSKFTDSTLGQAQAKEASTLRLSTSSFEVGRVERQSV
jgi:hypothetical protein